MPRISVLLIIISLLVTGLLGCEKSSSPPEAESIYINGQVITVDDNIGTVDAIAVKDGRIIALGSNSAVSLHKGNNTKVINLEGKPMLTDF